MTTGSQGNAQYYDLIIVGAGIFGAMLALESSQRGLKVLLVEKNDFGGGTSANSLKTIHGGLRYLQSFDIRSSIISAKERKAWLTIAPGLVRPLSCILPTTNDLMKSKFLVGGGAWLYNALTRRRNVNMPVEAQIPNAHLLSISALHDAMPNLTDDSVTGGACWHDAQAINTERLIIACLFSAKQYGAQMVNYHALENLRKANAGYTASLIDSSLTRPQNTEKVQVFAPWFIDCTGRGEFLEKEFLECKPEKKHRAPTYVKAVNLVVKKSISEHALGLKAKDASGMSRLLFLTPWLDGFAAHAYALIGTWYFDTRSGELNAISEDELNACIAQVNSAFFEPLFAIEDITQVHLGHLPADPGRLIKGNPDTALKKHAELTDWGETKIEYEGMYSLKGTKFTLARKAAEDTINYLEQKYALKLAPSISASTPLWAINVTSVDQLELMGWSQEQISFALLYFPCGIQKIMALCADNAWMCAPIPGAAYCCHAVLEYCLRHEQVHHLTDMLVRRLPLGNAELPAKETITYTLELMAGHFFWDEQRRAQEVNTLEKYYMKRLPEDGLK